MGPVVFLSGYNQRAVFTLLRICSKYQIDIRIVADGQEDPIFQTAYTSGVAATRTPGSMDSLFLHLKQIGECSGRKPVTIMPTTEYLNRWLISNREDLRQHNIMVPLTDQKIYNLISDKLLFYDFCKSAGLPVPDCYCRDKLIFPCIAKAPRYIDYMGKPVFLRNAGEHSDLLENYPGVDWMYQRYVEGDSYYLLYYFAKDGSVVRHSQHNVAQQHGGRSILAAASADIHNTSLAASYEKAFLSVRYTGPVMVELKRSGNDYLMIEANPRPWGPCQLVADANVPIFERYLADMGYDLYLMQEPERPALYFWEDGFDGSFGNADYFGADYRSIGDSLPLWRSADVLNRPDTEKLYKGELQQYE